MAQRILGGLLLGLLAGGACAAGAGIAAAYLFDIPQFEGAYAMGVAFFWVPLGALIGAIAGAIIGLARGRRR